MICLFFLLFIYFKCNKSSDCKSFGFYLFFLFICSKAIQVYLKKRRFAVNIMQMDALVSFNVYFMSYPFYIVLSVSVHFT